MSNLTLEKLQATQKLLEMPFELEQDDELMFNVADKLHETSGEYFTRWQGVYVWMRFDATRHAWYHSENPIGMQCFPSHWLDGRRRSLPVDAIRRPEKSVV